MAVRENPPFGRGQTYYNGGTIDSNDLKGQELEGQEFWFPDVDWTASGVGAKPKRSERMIKVRVVRNTSGGALLPKRIARFEADGLEYGARVDGMTRTTAERGYPIDEFLPDAGVPNNDLFYVVVEGPAMVLTPLEGDANNVFSVGTVIVALTAATSGATTAGRARPQDLTGATAVLGDNIQNRIGRALSAKTTGNTNADLLVEVGKW
jgi:hypothetical protein